MSCRKSEKRLCQSPKPHGRIAEIEFERRPIREICIQRKNIKRREMSRKEKKTREVNIIPLLCDYVPR